MWQSSLAPPPPRALLAYSKPHHQYIVDNARLVNLISIDGVPVPFSSEVEHVGIVRSISGNMPNLLNRISAHKSTLGAILGAGLALSHRGNPAAALRVHSLYCAPILFSGLASLVLMANEIKILDAHYQKTLQKRANKRTISLLTTKTGTTSYFLFLFFDKSVTVHFG